MASRWRWTRTREFAITRIISKLGGRGPLQPELIRAVAASLRQRGSGGWWSTGGEYYFRCEVRLRAGRAAQHRETLTAAINEIKPAHLRFVYEYLYRTWGAG